jgi:hypothetical protein
MELRDYAGALSLLKKALPEEHADLNLLDRLYLYDNLAAAYAHAQQFDSAYLFQMAAYAVRDSIFNENKQKEVTRFQTERYKRETAQQALLTQAEAFKARMLFFCLVAAFGYRDGGGILLFSTKENVSFDTGATG